MVTSDADHPRHDRNTKITAKNLDGAAVQAGSVTGDIHIHESARTAKTPRPNQLPSPPRFLIGRDQELTKLDELLDDHSNNSTASLVVIAGPGGVGKTALALTWLHKIKANFQHGNLFANLRPSGRNYSLPVADVLSQFLRALDVPAERIPIDVTELTTMYRSATADRPVSILLDNATSATEVQPFLSSGNSLVVVTSRNYLSGLISERAALLRLNPLSDKSSIDILRKIIGNVRIAQEPGPAKRLVQLCECLPLALSIVGARLSNRPERSIAREASNLEDEHQRIRNLSTNETLSLQACLDFSYRNLPIDAQNLYRTLGLHPGNDFTAEMASAASGLPLAETERIFDTLIEASLLEESSHDRYYFNDLTRIHALQCANTEMQPSTRVSTEQTIIEWYLHVASAADRKLAPYRTKADYRFEQSFPKYIEFPDRSFALRWLDAEQANLLSVTRHAYKRGLAELTWHLCDALWSLLLYRRHNRDRLEVDELGVASARAWGNRLAEADMLKRLGQLHGLLNRFAAATEYLEKAISINDECGDTVAKADAMADLGRVYLNQNMTDKAQLHLKSALTIYQTENEIRRTGLTYINLGLTSIESDDSASAMKYFNAAHAIFSKMQNTDPYNYARSLIALGRGHAHFGEYPTAARHLSKGLDLMVNLGSKYRLVETRELLGEIAEKSGETEEAILQYESAAEIYRSLDMSKKNRFDHKVATLRQRLGGPN